MAGRQQRTVLGPSLFVVGLTLGLLLSIGSEALTDRRAGEAAPAASDALLAVERLESEQRQLKASLADLRQELIQRQWLAAADVDRLQGLRAELERQQLIAGLLPVQGSGVAVTLDDSQVQVPPGADPNAYIVHEYDLRDIVNLLWLAGSEAVAVNGERLVSSSSLYCVGTTVMVNNTRLSPPYIIRAIGNPRVQQDYLRNPSYLRELKDKKRQYGLRIEVTASEQMTLPAYSAGFLVKYARPSQ